MPKKILIVDTGRPFLLQLRNDLGQYREHFGALLTEKAGAVTAAIDQHQVSVVVAGSQMKVDGVPLPVHLFNQGVMVPVILLQDDTHPQSTEDWAACIVRTLTKPVDSLALANTVLSVLKDEALEGLMHGVTSSSFFQFMEVEEKTCTIKVTPAQGDTGLLFFRQGKLLDARLADQTGLNAALDIFAWEKVDLAILNFCPLKENAIGRSIGSLLMEAAVAQDHAAAEAQGVTLSPKKETTSPVRPSALEKLKPLEASESVEAVVPDASWNDLLSLAETLGRDLGSGPPELSVLSGVDGGRDLIIVPDQNPIAVHVRKLSNRDVVVEKVLAELEKI